MLLEKIDKIPELPLLLQMKLLFVMLTKLRHDVSYQNQPQGQPPKKMYRTYDQGKKKRPKRGESRLEVEASMSASRIGLLG